MKEFFKAILDFNLNRLFREKTTNIFIQFFRYIFVGGFAFWRRIYFVVMRKRMNYMIAAAIAFVVGLAVNYALSIWFVFSESSKVKNKVKEFVVYGIIGLIGLLITEGIMYLFTDVFGLYFLISKIIAAAIVLVWNFAARKVVLYK